MKALFIKSIGAIIMALLISTGSFAQEITVNGATVLRSSSKASSKAKKRAEKTITGTVTCDGIPVYGAYVKIESKNGGATHTNENGKYQISIPQEGATLTFSSWTLEPLSIEVKDQSVVDVALQENTQNYGLPQGETLPPDAHIIEGTVTANGEPVIGAYVLIKGTKTGVSTNWRGKFAIAAPKKGTLIFSMVGFKTVKVRIKGRQTINVDMQEETVILDDRDLNRAIKKLQRSKR